MNNDEMIKMLMEHECQVRELTDKDASVQRRISALEQDVKDLRNLTLAVQRIGDKLEVVANKVNSIDNRTQKLEEEPGEDLKHYKRLIIGGVLTTVLGAILGAVLALIIK